MSRQEIMLKEHLETVLKQVQSAVKEMDMQPVQLTDIRYIVMVPRRRAEPAYFRPRVKSDAEEQHLKRMQILEKFSLEIKDYISLQIDNQGMTAECGQQLLVLVECMERNMTLALDMHGSSFTLHGLAQLIKVPEKMNKGFEVVYKYASFAKFAVTIAGSALGFIGTSPIHFNAVGKQANSIVNEDFTFDVLKLNSDVDDHMSAAICGQIGGGQKIGQLMTKVKRTDCSLSCDLLYITNEAGAANGPENRNPYMAVSRFSLKDLWGGDVKCVVEIPYPTGLGKFEMRGLRPYLSYSGSVQLLPNNVGQYPNCLLDMSGLLGVKNFGTGCQFLYSTEEENNLNCALGMSFHTELMAIGLKYKHHPGVCSASYVKKIVDTGTTVAAVGSYSREAGKNRRFRCTVGLKHCIDPTFYCKARIGAGGNSPGASLLFKKSFNGGMWTVKGSAHVDFKALKTRPKLGVTCSVRW